MRDTRAMFTAGRPDWATPPEIFNPLNAEFGFTLDVCASSENTKVQHFYDEEADALSQTWRGRCFMNPPYGRGIGRWIQKAYESSLSGATVVCLVPARTDTAWWHDYVEGKAETRFLRGRVRFVGAPYNAPFPNVVLVYRPAMERAA